MFKIFQLFEHGNLPDGTHGHAIISARLDADFLDGHELTVILEITSLQPREWRDDKSESEMTDNDGWTALTHWPLKDLYK